MTALRLVFADPGEAAGLAAFLGRLLRWERSAAVRLQAGSGVLGVFARPARFGVLAVRTARLLESAELDATVAAGELLEGVDEADEAVSVPGEVTGPSWAGLLPPRGGWRPVTELPLETVRGQAAGVVAEFRERTERLEPEKRTREVLDALAEEIWERRLPGTELPLRAVHAAHALGFLRGAAESPGTSPEASSAGPGQSVAPALLEAGRWLRLRTPYGSVIVRNEAGPAAGLGLSVTPL